MLRYPARFEPVEGGGFLVMFRDVPEAITQGETIEEALAVAADALAAVMNFYFEDRRPVPIPSEVEDGEELVALSVSMSDKVLAFNKMLNKT
ncbi:MAG TPA: type II toxin-antitoxin system HicB family antitoxin [Paraburkholderia sp.]|uniref:type II toxin-antitoxin system HicB family antitoxin n=1 Tax=Paraburkholderia sp. TaxID=1926495 RepID=UPI002B48D2A0|nr:type II toxin-antitoxin system HicB family antitoxin [Paraburkholderia sp.]HKR46770.1 type II toxin-antitoxin system HicB family antitoxin [Paraburkholderia sp.]